MKFAYADPPYLGWAKSFYGKLHPEAAVWDKKETHIKLVEKIMDEYKDGWALSCHAPALHFYLQYVPKETRICAWSKTMFNIRPNVSVNYSWEALLLFGGRKEKNRRPFVKDSCVGARAMKKGLRGSKPDYFNDWVLDLLNYKIGDELDDLFVGTGGMGEAIQRRIIKLSDTPERVTKK